MTRGEMHSDMIGESVPDPCFYDLNTQDTLPSKNVSKVRRAHHHCHNIVVGLVTDTDTCVFIFLVRRCTVAIGYLSKIRARQHGCCCSVSALCTADCFGIMRNGARDVLRAQLQLQLMRFARNTQQKSGRSKPPTPQEERAASADSTQLKIRSDVRSTRVRRSRLRAYAYIIILLIL